MRAYDKIFMFIRGLLFIAICSFLLLLIASCITLDPYYSEWNVGNTDSLASTLGISLLFVLPPMLFFMLRKLIFGKSIIMKCYCFLGIVCVLIELYQIGFVLNDFSLGTIISTLFIIGVCFGVTKLCELLKKLCIKLFKPLRQWKNEKMCNAKDTEGNPLEDIE